MRRICDCGDHNADYYSDGDAAAGVVGRRDGAVGRRDGIVRRRRQSRGRRIVARQGRVLWRRDRLWGGGCRGAAGMRPDASQADVYSVASSHCLYIGVWWVGGVASSRKLVQPCFGLGA